MKKYMIVAAMFLVLGAVIGAVVVFGGEEKGEEAAEISLHHVEIEYHAPEGTTGVTLYSNFNGTWDANSRSENGDLAFSLDKLPSGEYLFNLNFYDVAPYWACTGSPSLVDYPASMVGDLEVKVDGRPVKVELESNHMNGCNLRFYAGWCGNNPESCAQVLSASAKATMLWSLGIDPNQL